MRYGALERPEKESQGKSGTGRNGRESPEAGISNRQGGIQFSLLLIYD